MLQHVRLVARLGSLVAVATLVAAIAGTAAAAAGRYVSLGDSYTAGPLVPNPTGNPILCGRCTNTTPLT